MCLTKFLVACVILLLHIPWHMLFFTKSSQTNIVTFVQHMKKIVRIPFMLCNYYVENQSIAFFLKRGRPKSRSLSKLICCAKEHYWWLYISQKLVTDGKEMQLIRTYNTITKNYS